VFFGFRLGTMSNGQSSYVAAGQRGNNKFAFKQWITVESSLNCSDSGCNLHIRLEER
jgi:hypothetical protein